MRHRRSHPPNHKLKLATPALGLVIAAFAGSPAHSEDAEPRRLAVKVETAEPAGFAGLTAEQQTIADVYFGEQKVGTAKLTFRPGSVSFADAVAVAALVPGLTTPKPVEAVLADPQLVGNAHLVCTPGADPSQCNRLSPEIAGIIFDEARFRVSLFVNPALLTIGSTSERLYLASAEPGLALVNSIAAVVSGSSGRERIYNLQDRLVMGDADRRLRADVSYASGYGLLADRIAVEVDRPGWRYSGGLFWTPDLELTGRFKLVGGGITSQIDTRLDKDQLRGNPLIVFLNQRARVEILRDGRLLTSRIYPPGNQTLDTSTLPDGAYEVELRIEEGGGAVTRERRFFARQALLPAQGERILFAYAGMLADDTRPGLLNLTDSAFFQFGLGKRLSPQFAADGTAMLVGKTVLAQLGATYLNDLFQIRGAALGMSNGSYGAILRISSSSNSRFNFDFDLRRIHVAEGSRSFRSEPSVVPGSSFASGGFAPLAFASQSFSQVHGNLSYSFVNARLSVAGYWRRSSGNERDYAIGPSARIDLVHKGPLRLFANADLTLTNRGRAGFVGLGVHLTGQRGGATGTLGVRSSDFDGPVRKTAVVGSLQGNWQAVAREETQLTVGGGYDRALDHQLLNGTVELSTRPIEMRGDVIQGLGSSPQETSYSLGFETTIAVRGGHVAFEGQTHSDSVVLIDLGGAAPGVRFDVLINEAITARVTGGERLPLSLTPYREYDVRIRQTGGDLASYDGAARKVALYPGNVIRLAWSATAQLAVFGRILDHNGQPIANAVIESGGSNGQTDDNGYFGIQTVSAADLVVRRADGADCRIGLPVLAAKDGYARAGVLTCPPTKPDSGSMPEPLTQVSLKRLP